MLGYDHNKALTLIHLTIRRCPLFCTWAKRATRWLAHLFFSLLAWLPLVTMSDNPTVLVVLGPTPGSTDCSSSFPLVFVFLLKSLLNCQGWQGFWKEKNCLACFFWEFETQWQQSYCFDNGFSPPCHFHCNRNCGFYLGWIMCPF